MHNLSMVGGERPGHFDRVLALFAVQLPDAKRMVALFNHQTGQGSQIAKLLRLRMAGKKLRRRAENTVVGRKLAGNQIRRDIVADANIEIHPFID